MKIFLAWSGESSRRAAMALRDWLPLVLQRVQPFMSEEDIRKGARWRQEVAKQLSSVSFAILCLTRDNLKSPWIHFEAGAIATHAEQNKVTALLLGIEHKDVVDPLKEFQHTAMSEGDILKLVKDLNASFEKEAVDPARLELTFRAFWPQLRDTFAAALTTTVAPTTPRRTPDELLTEVLEICRGNSQTAAQILEGQQVLLLATGATIGMRENVLSADARASLGLLERDGILRDLYEGVAAIPRPGRLTARQRMLANSLRRGKHPAHQRVEPEEEEVDQAPGNPAEKPKEP